MYPHYENIGQQAAGLTGLTFDRAYEKGGTVFIDLMGDKPAEDHSNAIAKIFKDLNYKNVHKQKTVWNDGKLTFSARVIKPKEPIDE